MPKPVLWAYLDGQNNGNRYDTPQPKTKSRGRKTHPAVSAYEATIATRSPTRSRQRQAKKPSQEEARRLDIGRKTAQYCAVAKTNATWFGSQNCKRRTHRHSWRFFIVRTPLRASFGRAIAGRAHALPVSVCAGLPTLLSARPPHLEVGSGFNLQTEAIMASLSHVHLGRTASPAHTLVFANAGAHAAAQWLNSAAPSLSLAAFRESSLHHLLAHATPGNVAAAMAVFRQAYARRVATFIAGDKRRG